MNIDYNGRAMIKRKWRWFFEALNKAGKRVFYNGVKVGHNPSFHWVGTSEGIKYIPGDIDFWTKGVDPLKDLKTLESFDRGVLTLADGIGNVVQRWDMKGIRVKSAYVDRDETYINVAFEECRSTIVEGKDVLSGGLL